MDFFIKQAHAQGGTAASGGSILPTILMFAVFIVFMYFMIIRPQMKRQKEHQEKVSGLKKGDQVVTAGGLVGKIVKVDEHYADIELGKDIRVKAVKSTIGDVIPPGGTAAND